jgi:cytochrome c oxidase assembly protein subunit 15
MGCPDWPKCFGSWIPPTEVSQLPLNYKEIYGAKLNGEVVFNPVKTWIEYVNRLLGAFTGIMIFLTLLASVPYLKVEQKHVFYYSLLAFILVGMQGWLGAKVVSSELMPVMITLHMLLAIVIVFLLLYLFTWVAFFMRREEQGFEKGGVIGILNILVISFSLAQILLGTQVRESMDEVIKILGYEARGQWVAELGMKFYVHRSFSIIVALANLFWFYKINQKYPAGSPIRKAGVWCLVIIGTEILSGVTMAYLGVPAFIQPLHLVFAVVLIGIQFVTWLLINGAKYLTWENPGRREKELV